MAWQQWDPDTRSLFRQTVIQDQSEMWRDKDTVDKNFIRGMFDYGFVRSRISSPVRVEARNRFFEELDIEPVDFDWKSWRIYMGYDEDSD